MKFRIFLPMIVLFSFLQGPFLPLVFFEGFLVTLTSLYDEGDRFSPKTLSLLFFGGLILDLVQGQARLLGLSSLIFISLSFLLFFLKTGLFSRKAFFLAASAFLIDIIRGRVVFGEIFLVPSLLTGIVTFLFFVFVFRPSSIVKING